MNPPICSRRGLSLTLAGLSLCAAFAGARAESEPSPLRPWGEYRTILWISEKAFAHPEKVPLFFQRMREMGINTGMTFNGSDPKPFIEAGMPFYVENIANRGLCLKFSSNVMDWNKHVTEWAKTRDEAGLVRDYTFEEPKWREGIFKEVRGVVKRMKEHSPLAYDLRDELSTTISANPFDYDFSPVSLEAFRTWLKDHYADLAALNAEWQTAFKTWDDVRPFTTDQIKNRMATGDAIPRGKPDWQALQKLGFDPQKAAAEATRWNFSPWADHRTFMDVSLARVLGDLREAVHAIDPKTPVGIEGTQMPSAFGGYDLWRLSQVLDWVEPYDIGNAREIFGSFMPGKPLLATIGDKDPNTAMRRLWHLLLSGDKGCLVWWSEDCIDWASADYALTPKAKALAPALKEMTSPLGSLFLRAEREWDPIAIEYSQASIQVDWLLGSREDGSTWLRRFSSYETTHNRLLNVRNAWLKALTDLGFSPRFVSSAQIEAGALTKMRVCVLPQALALSQKEVSAIENFVGLPNADDSRSVIPGLLLCDGSPGLFDEHGKLRASSPFGALGANALSSEKTFAWAGPAALESRAGDVSKYAGERLAGEPSLEWARWLGGRIAPLLSPAVSVPLEARTSVFRYRLSGTARLVAFERNISYQMSESLAQAGGNEALEHSLVTRATLQKPAHVYELRSGRYLGKVESFEVSLDPWQPALFALLDEKASAGHLLEFLQSALPGS